MGDPHELGTDPAKQDPGYGRIPSCTPKQAGWSVPGVRSDALGCGQRLTSSNGDHAETGPHDRGRLNL